MDLSWLYTRPGWVTHSNTRQFKGEENKAEGDAAAWRLKHHFGKVAPMVAGNTRDAQSIEAVMNNSFNDIPTNIEYRTLPDYVPQEVTVTSVNDPDAETMKRPYSIDPQTFMMQLLAAWQSSHSEDEKAELKKTIEQFSADYKYMAQVRRNTVERMHVNLGAEEYKRFGGAQDKFYKQGDEVNDMWRDFVFEAAHAPESQEPSYALEGDMPSAQELGTLAWTQNRNRNRKDALMSHYRTLEVTTDLADPTHLDDRGQRTYFLTQRI